MLKLRALCSLVLVTASTVYAVGKSFTIDDVMKAPFATGLVAAPSGAAAA